MWGIPGTRHKPPNPTNSNGGFLTHDRKSSRGFHVIKSPGGQEDPCAFCCPLGPRVCAGFQWKYIYTLPGAHTRRSNLRSESSTGTAREEKSVIACTCRSRIKAKTRADTWDPKFLLYDGKTKNMITCATGDSLVSRTGTPGAENYYKGRYSKNSGGRAKCKVKIAPAKAGIFVCCWVFRPNTGQGTLEAS